MAPIAPLFPLVLCVAPPAPAPVLAPGAAQGVLRVGPRTVTLTRAQAWLHDNAEGELEFPKELRILLTDRDLPGEPLQGLTPVFPLTEQVEAQRVAGLLLRLDPADAHRAYVTFLVPPPHPGQSLVTQTRVDTGQPVLARLVVTDQEVSGEIEGHPEGEGDPEVPEGDYRVAFRAPLAKEPAVTSDLRGPAARQSAQVKVLLQLARLEAKGDLKGARAFLTEAAARHHEAQRAAMGPGAAALERRYGQEMLKALPKAGRVVVRGDRAVVLADGYTFHLAREGGAWRLD